MGNNNKFISGILIVIAIMSVSVLLLVIAFDERMPHEIRYICGVIGFVMTVYAIVQFAVDDYTTLTTKKNSHNRIGYVFLSNTQRSGKGLARTQERAVEKMLSLASSELKHPLSIKDDMYQLCDKLIENAEDYFRECHVIIVSGNCHAIATNMLAKYCVPDVVQQ